MRGFIQTLLRHLGVSGVLTISRHTQRAGDRASHSDQPVPLNNQVLKRDKQAQNKKTKPNPPDQLRRHPRSGLSPACTCVSHEGPCQRGHLEVRLRLPETDCRKPSVKPGRHRRGVAATRQAPPPLTARPLHPSRPSTGNALCRGGYANTNFLCFLNTRVP